MYENESVLLRKTDKNTGKTRMEQVGVLTDPHLKMAEQIIQTISIRYAHEVLNALTPALGVMQILKYNPNKQLSNRDYELIQLAQDELMKGKNFISDFMTLNSCLEPDRQYVTLQELKEYIEVKLTEQAPEYIPYINFQIVGSGDDRVLIDANQLRLAIYFIVNGWVDYATCPSIITIMFDYLANDELHVKMNMSQKKVSIGDTEDGFKFFLHIIEEQVKRNFGKMMIGEGITLVYPREKQIS